MITACIVQARMTSTRLPGKVMLSLGGEPVIRHVLRRCQAIEGVDVVVCAVPDGDKSTPIKREAIALGVRVATGLEHDVLSRYHSAALAVDADIVMRITGDCPMTDPIACARILALLTDGVDYVASQDCEVFTFNALDRAHKEADDPYDREHVCPWMRRNLCVVVEEEPVDRRSLDDLEDYLFLSGKFHEHG